MRQFFLSILLFLGLNVAAQPDSCGIKFSLLTCTPGDELYSSFGHSALRMVNTENGSDLVFNYGTFDFDDPDFYTKFTRGKLLYFVSVDAFPDFMMEYQYFQRGVTEQDLRLTCAEKQKLLYALYENAREENKYYRYDFNYDNCTSRLRDMIWKMTPEKPIVSSIVPAGTSFRNLIHEYLDKGKQQWSKLGIDILLGAPLDKQVTNEEAMFLPDYLMKALDSARVNGEPLVTAKRELLTRGPEAASSFSLDPALIFTILFILYLFPVFTKNKRVKRIGNIMDGLLFGITGLIGILLVFMWWGTDHAMCRNNWNLAWALPTHFIMAFFVTRQKAWVRSYFMVVALLSVILLVAWFWLPQQLNYGLMPVVALLGFRGFWIGKLNARHYDK
ncbi:MAG: DUF4105 domain-containing protein [Chitinophagales bacterium]|nr:DUF4105 domain-containing protein [Chitinophagales bacterium]